MNAIGDRKMSEKKYFWLKMHKDFFVQKEIKKLRRIAGGDTFTIIYLKMQLKSLDTGGKLYYEGFENDFAEELALELDETPDNVKLTLAYLSNHSLVGKTDNMSVDEYVIPAVQDNTGTETSSAIRVRKHREKKKLLLCNNAVTPMQQIVNGELELDLEKEIKLEKDIKKKAVKKEAKHKHGEHKNILLTDEEFEKLEKKLTKSQISLIFEKLSSYKLASGKKYKSDYGAINSWVINAVTQQQGKSSKHYDIKKNVTEEDILGGLYK